MGSPDLFRRVPLMLVLLLAAVPVFLAQEHIPETDQQSEEFKFPFTKEELKDMMKDLTKDYQLVPLPGLPPISVEGDTVSITLSLADIYLHGLTDVDLEPIADDIKNFRAGVKAVFHKISLFVGTYSSGGHLLNLPFNGEGPMYLHLHGLSFGVTMAGKPVLGAKYKVCAVSNSTALDFDLERMETRFENLNQNEGADLGQLVEIVVPSFGQDIVQQLAVLLSNKYLKFIDPIVIGLANHFLECDTKPIEDILKADELIEVMNGVIRDLVPGALIQDAGH